MAVRVSNFKSNLAAAGGGARPALFSIDIDSSFTTATTFSPTDNILVKAAAIPASTIAPLAVNYGGRAYKWTGFRTFDNWTTTVINDETFFARQKIMEWMRLISGYMTGERDNTYGTPSRPSSTTIPYKEGEATVKQLSADGSVVQTYKFHNLWPTELAEIPMDWSSDVIQEYTVSWCYDSWTHGSGLTSSTSVVS